MRRAVANLFNAKLREVCATELRSIEEAGTFKRERVIVTKQQAAISVKESKEEVINFCANNYLAASAHPKCIQRAHELLDQRGAGLSSVRFICGTQDCHIELEETIAKFLDREAAIAYPSCFDANAGVFEALLTAEDAIISDELNHASIIDGVRLCKAERHRYTHLDMNSLEEILKSTQSKRMRMIATDGVFSMDGDIAPLDKICSLATKYNAAVFVDDAHATGYFGPGGKGTPHHFGVVDKVDVLNSTLGKAMGGASGGFSAGCKEMVTLQRQRSRPYLFSNALAPAVVGTSLAVFEMLNQSSALQQQLRDNTKQFREGMTKAGFRILGHPDCPIAPVWFGDARVAAQAAEAMLRRGIYVIGFSYPVVPKGKARIRVQLSAGHTPEQIDKCVKAFTEVKKEMGL